MKVGWIDKKGSERLILIFAGWSTDMRFYSHIHLKGWDVAVTYDYSDFDFPYGILDKYKTIALFAWSLGVYAASRVLPSERISIAVAVNGTQKPADDSYGIPVSIYNGTTGNLNTRNLERFRRRMAGKDYPSLTAKFSHDIPIPTLGNELEIIKKDSFAHDISEFRWHKAYISTSDLIFPTESQIRFWKALPGNHEIITVDSPHYIDLLNIIKGTLPSGEIIGSEFKRAHSTYDSHAHAQTRIAHHLASMAGKSDIAKCIEIGTGTGILSRNITKRIKIKSIDYVDLYPVEKLNIAPEERYFTADAECWMEERARSHPGSADLLISASAIQWFVNPKRFFLNASESLRPGGTLLCSTFLPGNISEIQAISPFGLVYRSRQEIMDYLKPCFSEISMDTEEIIIDFDSPREVLMHLRNTGVGGGIKTNIPLSRILRELPTRLTYRPLYIKAIK